MAEGSQFVNTERQSELNISASGSLQDFQPLEAPGVPGTNVTAGQNESRLNVFRYIAGLKDKELDKGVSVCDVVPTLSASSGGSTWSGNNIVLAGTAVSGSSFPIGPSTSTLDPRFSCATGFNIPVSSGNTTNPMMFALQEQLRQTQSMCIQQQSSLDKLTAAVASLTKQHTDNDTRSCITNYDEISSEDDFFRTRKVIATRQLMMDRLGKG